MSTKGLKPRVLLIASFFSIALLLAVPCLAEIKACGKKNSAAKEYFDTIKGAPKKLADALTKFPKGADLHNHLSGSIQPGDYIALGEANEACFGTYTSNTPMLKIFTNCTPDKIKLTDASASDVENLKRSLSMYRFFDKPKTIQDGHNQFFDTFKRFGDLSGADNMMVPLIVRLMQASAADRVSYVETMTSFRSKDVKELAAALSSKYKEPDSFRDKKNYQRMLDDLNGGVDSHAIPLSTIAKGASSDAGADLKNARAALNCDDAKLSAPGCEVSLAFQVGINRNSELPVVFTQAALYFMLADMAPDSVVGVNLLSGEDGKVSMRDFDDQMEIIKFFHAAYPKVNIALHGGEFTPCFFTGGTSDPSLKSHLTKSIEAGAKRLGHAVSFAYLNRKDRDNVSELMKARGVLVEVPFTSNAQILGAVANRKEHPFADYMARGVPVALATDDEGVSYSDFTSEWIYAVRHYGVSFSEAQRLARSSIESSFLPGASLWQDWKKLKVNEACKDDKIGSASPEKQCNGFLEANKKAKMQWEYERRLIEYKLEFGEKPWEAGGIVR